MYDIPKITLEILPNQVCSGCDNSVEVFITMVFEGKDLKLCEPCVKRALGLFSYPSDLTPDEPTSEAPSIKYIYEQN